MNIIEQYCTWFMEPPADTLEILERAARTCYKSEDKITPTSAGDFIRRLMSQDNPHESVIEHVSAGMRFITDRGVTHEMVRHRIASYSQESTRYCNYCKGKFGEELTIILPVWFTPYLKDDQGCLQVGWPLRADTPVERSAQFDVWREAMKNAEYCYRRSVEEGASAQEARSVLPNSLKTEIVMTANLREWRHFFRLRCSQKAHPQMRDLALKALAMFQEKVPVLFEGLT